MSATTSSATLARGASAALSRSTAVTAWPRAASKRAYRPLPAATSRTLPSAAIRCAQRSIQGDGDDKDDACDVGCGVIARADGKASEAGPDPVGEVDGEVGPLVGGEHCGEHEADRRPGRDANRLHASAGRRIAR